MHWLLRRLSQKLRALVLILLVSGLLMLILSLFVNILLPLLPESLQGLYRSLKTGDLTQARTSLWTFFAGPEGAVRFVILQAAQVIFAPIPGQLPGLLGGALFGFWLGLGLSSLGLTLGSGLMLVLGRVGRYPLQRFLPATWLETWLPLLEYGGVMRYFLMFLVPAFPDDALCLLAGMTRLPLFALLLASFLGRLPSLVMLCLAGSHMNQHPAQFWLSGGLLLSFSLVLWFFQEEVEGHLRKRWQNAFMKTEAL